eukprot:CAMPEP_0181273874 /NCGR_PEP_ID=MMETSP1097-20121128/8898_1 /TAXON_ID=35684 /ORGANISM="Pseudopedinella elastica, Strain CCMP716" /LENGTH=61 /DNA_ID=CAMNT_0023374861 /DNA_START=86 /DNA_END=268 /DNA_ORIENTATION=+
MELRGDGVARVFGFALVRNESPALGSCDAQEGVSKVAPDRGKRFGGPAFDGEQVAVRAAHD